MKIRPWATVWRAETPTGVHFAKQNCATQAYEAALLVELNALAPHHVVPLTAGDLDRGLLMTPDRARCSAPMDGGELEEWGSAAATSPAALRRDPPVGHLRG